MGGRPIWSVAAAACVSIVLVACVSSGTRTQSFSPSPTDPQSSLSSPSTANSGPTTQSSPPPTSKTTGASIATPTVVPAAQAAVNAYIGLIQATVEADRDPAHADLAKIDAYLTGKARNLVDAQYGAMKRTGQAYRGSPADPRLKVQSIISPVSIVLSSCPLGSRTDPYVEYYVATGKPVPVRKHNPPTPYRAALFMTQVSGQWKLSDLVQDASKTCTG